MSYGTHCQPGENGRCKPAVPDYSHSRQGIDGAGLQSDASIQTLIMLSQLPFPKHLRQVPEIASGHHEKMDGTGYPKGLRGEDMSPLARMLAIADIFEALTAVDRPYKKGKTLSEAIKIMSLMKKDQYIDPDLFDLFLHSGVYRDYANLFLKPEQIDEVEVATYVA